MRSTRFVCLAALGLAACLVLQSTSLLAQLKKEKGVWADPADSTLPPDFKVQGEYSCDTLGCQVIALGGGYFQAVVYPGGLPGAGWDNKNKSLMDGKLDGDKTAFKPATGKRKYKGQKPEEFSATANFPPTGQKEYTASGIL